MTSLTGRAWMLWSAGALVPLAGYFVLPAAFGWDVQTFLYCLISGSTAGALAVGIRRHRPRPASVWWLFAAGQVMYTGGDLMYYFASQDDASYPPLANVLYLAQYVLVAAALVRLTRRRTPQRNTAALVDTAILAVGAGVLWWVFLILPTVSAPGVDTLDRVAATAYPVMDLCVLTVAVRLMLNGGARQPAYQLLLAFLGLTLLGDTTYGLLTLSGSFADGGWADGIWLLSYVALGAAGLHPSMRHIADPAEPRSGSTPYRLLLLGTATAMAPAVLVVQTLRGEGQSDLVVVGASAVLFLLVLVRMAGLIAAQRRLAITDALTGLHTRRFLTEQLRLESERAARHGESFALLLIDVDHFKGVNDTYGHPAGDQVLVEVARRLRSACRGGDVVARFGGEEFAVLAGATGPDDLAGLAERIRTGMSREPVLVDGRTPVTVTISIGGTAAVPPHRVTADTLVTVADAALYTAKRAGRDRVVITDPAERPEPAVAASTPDDVAWLDQQIGAWAAVLGDAARRRPDAVPVPAGAVAGVCAAWAFMRADGDDGLNLPADRARAELRRCRGVQFPAHLVDEFLTLQAAGVIGAAGPGPLALTGDRWLPAAHG
ncbi:GGDEF domain-containing protein [Nucisporomicrobium flavum]|uniref:GGDEF domain-containing protein n=1 Tax=Nucisporomicrobium flavum TaxID=2785915 RepID=UPI0018F71C90|nr:GGDEF domain-containing protein [Nucisporomicrobium flavum]